MSLSLLDLPDEALLLIFLALGSDTISLRSAYSARKGIESPEHRNEGTTRGLASCSRRLYSIHGKSVASLNIRRECIAADCARRWDRFPLVANLFIQFERPSYAKSNLFPQASEPGFGSDDSEADTGAKTSIPVTWPGKPGAFPNCLARNGIKRVRLFRGAIYVRELHEMMKNSPDLEELELRDMFVRLERETLSYTDDMCTSSLERNTGSLTKLVLSSAVVAGSTAGADRKLLDLRWFDLASMSSLSQLELYQVTLNSYALSELARITTL